MSPIPSHEQHQAFARAHRSVRCAVITVSDTRTLATDTGGPLIERHLIQNGHEVSSRSIVADEPEAITAAVAAGIADPNIQAILLTGGTGMARRDTTIEVVRRFLTVEMEGFGELFRMLSFEQVKAAAMLSRAVGGLAIREPEHGGDTFLFAMPGSPNAVELAMSRLIAPQLAHLVWERRR
jgi:molybdopterin adenylyltransferase